MASNVRENSKDLKHNIQELQEEIYQIKDNKCVDLIQEDGLIRTYDQRKYKTTLLKLYKNTFELEKNNYVQFKTTFKKVESCWGNYLSALIEELEYIKSQHTIRVPIENNSFKWVSDKNKVNEMVYYINSEKKTYRLWAEENKKSVKKVMLDLSGNRIIQAIVVVVIFISIPILVNYTVTKPAPINVETDNDWIGFLGDYIGGIFSAFVGGIVAYYISKSQIDRQKAKDFDDRIINLKIDRIPSIVDAVNSIKYLLVQERSYFQVVFEVLEKNDRLARKMEVNELRLIIENSIIKMDENKSKIFDSLDSFTKKINNDRALIYQWTFYANSIHNDILDLIRSASTFQEYIVSLLKNIPSQQNKMYPEDVKDKFTKLCNNYDNTEYNLYSLEIDLQNYLSKDVFGNVIDKMNKDDYFYGRRSD